MDQGKAWYHIATARYEHQRFLYIDHKLALHYKPDPESTHIQHADAKLIHFLSWLSEEIRREIAQISKDTLQYKRYLEQHLPHDKRTWISEISASGFLGYCEMCYRTGDRNGS